MSLRKNVVLIPGFGVNAHSMSGLKELLESVFNVYIIEIPGTSEESPPPPKLSFKANIEYVNNKIDRLNLDSYLLAGISYGALYAYNCELNDERCRGIIALAPYVNSNYLVSPNNFDSFYLRALSGFIMVTRLYKVLWKSKFMDLLFRGRVREDIARNIKNNFDPRTFLWTYLFLTKYKGEFITRKLPYLLAMSRRDDILNYDKTRSLFEEKCSILNFIELKGRHLPSSFRKEYLKKIISSKLVSDVDNFFTNYY